MSDNVNGKEAPRSFEEGLERLEKIVEALEKGETSLEEGVALYKEGLSLATDCRARLEKARHEVRVFQDGKLREAEQEELDAGQG
ncbi:exodeoxyribonuclease VII small subunit [Desulfohalovibrio reitneri]|uniref:exodeoxyribonuclease VII small subunit n=1 Tax=Desulfohalovibrio reitneri TaxID=1307759 RepID=UPI000A67A189|nr:exodeoxyribonuclease VII small subunit [Desulfohalovibrio reitneri]